MTTWQPAYRVIFMHLPKTAGLTLRFWFRDQLGDAIYFPNVVTKPDGPLLRYLREETDTPPDRSSEHDRQAALWRELSQEEQDRTRVFMGHFFYGIHEVLPGPARYMTIVRNPVDRVLSLHAHRVANHRMDMPLERYLGIERDWEINNGQTRRLASGGVGGIVHDVTPTMFDVACERLHDFAVVGVTERFDESLVAFSAVFGWGTPGYKVVNQSEGRVQASELPGPLLDRLIERNEHDIKLHALADTLLDKSLVGIDTDAAVSRLHRHNRVLHYRARARQQLGQVKRMGSKVKRAALGRPPPP